MIAENLPFMLLRLLDLIDAIFDEVDNLRGISNIREKLMMNPKLRNIL